VCDVGDYTKFDCMDEIYEECESCESEICGICLKLIMNGLAGLDKDRCPVCGEEIY
jgi:hypothetical protein